MRVRATRLLSTSQGGGGLLAPAWTPALLAPTLWLDAADASTITLNGSTVSQWSDKSGNNRNATQTVGADQPEYRIAGLNGKNTIRANGDWLNVAAFGTTTYTWTIVTTARIANVNATVFGANSLSSTLCPIASSGSTSTELLRVNNVGNPAGAAQLFNGETTQSVATRNDIYLKFAADAIYTVADIPVIDSTITLGLGPFGFIYPGDIGEIVVSPPGLTVANRQKLEGYLAHKWGLTASLPADHPYRNTAPTV